MLPPHIPHPPLLQLFQWTTRPIGFMDEAARRYGDCFLVRFPRSPPLVFTSDPEMIRQIFTGKPEELHVGAVNRFAESVVGKNSLVLLDGKEHIHERRMMTPPFHGERMLAYGLSMRESADGVIDRWPLGKPFSLHAQFQEITLDVILKTVFGLSEVESLERFRKLLVRMLNLGVHPSMLFLSVLFPAERVQKLLSLGSNPIRLGPLKADMSHALPWARLNRLTQEVNTSLFAEIARRRTAGVEGREDILSMLMQARDEDGQPMSDQRLRDEVLTLLIAGHETSATTLAWMFHQILQRPDVEEKLRAELDEVTGTEPLAPGQVNRLEYLDATLKETMRLVPVVPAVGRVLQRPMKVRQWELPAGVAVMPCIYLAQRRSDAWPDPERFNPERFVGKRLNPYEYFPFGGGARRCLGMAFATYEMKIVFAEVLKRVRLRAATHYGPHVTRRGVTLAPAGGVPVIADAIHPRRVSDDS